MNTPDRGKGSGRESSVSDSRSGGRLHPSTLELLRERSGPDHTALPFAEAVTAQLVHPPGRRGPRQREHEVAGRVLALLAAPSGAGEAAALAAEPEMLSSFFQNIDLLYQHDFADADAVSLLVMQALAIADPPE